MTGPFVPTHGAIPPVEAFRSPRIEWRRWQCVGAKGQRHTPSIVELPAFYTALQVQPYCGRCGEPMERGGLSFYSGRRELVTR